MLEKIMHKIMPVAFGLGFAGLAGCGNDDECAAIEARYSSGYVVPAEYGAGNAADNAGNSVNAGNCPPGCRQTGETDTTYCCWCPD